MNNRNIKVVDEHAIDRLANIIFAFDLAGSEYVVYHIERDESSSNLFVSKIIKNIDQTSNLLDIDDENERKKMSDIVKMLVSKAFNDEKDKLDGYNVLLDGGGVINFIEVSFNKEQRINVPKSYITTVKKEISKIAEKYYNVLTSNDISMEVDNIFPSVNPTSEVAPAVLEPVQTKTTSTQVNVEVATSTIPVETGIVVEPITSPATPVAPVTTPVEEEKEFFALPEIDEVPIVANVEENTLVAPMPSNITVEQPVVNVVPEVVVTDSMVEPIKVEPVTTSVGEVKTQDSNVLVFDASKEKNLNAALGEVAATTPISIPKIEEVRDFGVDDVKAGPTPVVQVQPVPLVQSTAPEASKPVTEKAGFANNKFFMVIAVVFFLASCAFLGYEVFNYFQLVK